MSRTDLANVVGTAKETLVRLLRDFKNKGLIEAHGQGILIRNREAMLIEANIN